MGQHHRLQYLASKEKSLQQAHPYMNSSINPRLNATAQKLPRSLSGLIIGLFPPSAGNDPSQQTDTKSHLSRAEEQHHRKAEEMAQYDLHMREVVERHIEKNGTEEFRHSKIVVTER